MTTLRPLTAADLPAVLPIERELFSADPPWSENTFQSELSAVPATRWYIVAVEHASSGPKIVGYTGLMHIGGASEPADVQTIAVVPTRQRMRIGSKLMNALIAEAERRRAGSMMLDVRADNTPAIAFYETFGFEECARRRRYFADGTDGIVMSRPLP